ncbi:hypothetical protein Lser_V15G11284 [Lactuca serriola]
MWVSISYLRTILILQGGHIKLKRSLKSIPTVTFSSDHKCLTIGKRMMVAGATGGSWGLIADALTEKDIHGSYTSGGWKCDVSRWKNESCVEGNKTWGSIEHKRGGGADDNHDSEYGSSVNGGGENGVLTCHKKKRSNKEEDDCELESDDPSASKKTRVVWSMELHQQFVSAVNQLGIDSMLLLLLFSITIII